MTSGAGRSRYPRSLLAQEQVDHPAAAHVRARSAQVVDQVVGGTRLLQRVGEDGQLQGAVLAGTGSQPTHVGREPGRGKADGSEWVADHIAQQGEGGEDV